MCRSDSLYQTLLHMTHCITEVRLNVECDKNQINKIGFVFVPPLPVPLARISTYEKIGARNTAAGSNKGAEMD